MLHSTAPESHSTPFADHYRTVPDNRSAYSLATVYDMPSPTARTSLLSNSSTDSLQNYGAAGPSRPSSRKLLWNATLKMSAIFAVSTVLLGGTLWLALPTLEECVLLPRRTMNAVELTTSLCTLGKIDPHLRSQRALQSCRH